MKISKFIYDKDLLSGVAEIMTMPDNNIDPDFKRTITTRWDNQEDRLEATLKALLDNDPHWDRYLKHYKGQGEILSLQTGGGKEEEPDYSKVAYVYSDRSLQPMKTIYEYKRDLRGTCWTEIELTGNIVKSFSFCLLDYCWFDKCKFNGWGRKLSFKNCWFIECEFNKSFLMDITLVDCVFLNCNFNNAIFNSINRQKNILFLDCDFTNINFTIFDLSEIYFDNGCKFNKTQLRGDVNLKLANFGKNVLTLIKSIEEAPDIRIFVNYFNKHHEGYAYFAKGLMLNARNENNYSEELLFEYYWNIFSNKSRISKFISIANGKYLIGRYFMGFGYRYLNPLFSYLIINVIFSFLFLFSGIMYRGEIINRSIIFPLKEFGSFASDWFKCFYFSAITSLTIGYGDAYPLGLVSSFLTIILGFIEMILFTIFVVIFGRRFFR